MATQPLFDVVIVGGGATGLGLALDARFVAPGLTEAMARFAVRYEFARTVEDVFARRSRLLFLDAKAALESTDAVADVVKSETAAPSGRAAFKALVAKYLNPSH